VGDRVYDLTVRFPLDTRYDPEALGNLTLTSASGTQIPLSQVATITQRNGEGTITRWNNRRNLTIRIDLADRDLVSYLAEVKERIAQSVQFDQSKYRLEYGGQFENQERAQRRFTLILGLVLALMTLLLYTEFGKLRQALLILGIVPLAALGGLLALVVTGETLNVATAVGFIALAAALYEIDRREKSSSATGDRNLVEMEQRIETLSNQIHVLSGQLTTSERQIQALGGQVQALTDQYNSRLTTSERQIQFFISRYDARLKELEDDLRVRRLESAPVPR